MRPLTMRKLALLIVCLLAIVANAGPYTDNRPIAFMELRNCKEAIEQQFNQARAAKHLPATQPASFDYMLGYTQYASTCIKVMKAKNCQGFILWDESIEPDAQHYWGDPRIQDPTFAPYAKTWFQIFIKAGLKTGVCLRPGLLMPNALGGYDRALPVDYSTDLNAKAVYARDNFGCSLFYVDSNLNPSGGAIHPSWLDALQLFGWDLSKNLFICEYCDPVPWQQPPFRANDYFDKAMRYRTYSQIPTPLDVDPARPSVLGVLPTYDPSRHDDLVKWIKAGGILMTYGWFDDGDQVVKLYQDAGVAGFAPTTQPTLSPTTAPATRP